MEIARHGHSANYGTKSRKLTKAQIYWEDDSECITFSSRNIMGFNSGANYDYLVSLHLDDVVSIINVLGEKCTTESGAPIIEAMQPALRGLLRLVAHTTGLAPEKSS